MDFGFYSWEKEKGTGELDAAEYLSDQCFTRISLAAALRPQRERERQRGGEIGSWKSRQKAIVRSQVRDGRGWDYSAVSRRGREEADSMRFKARAKHFIVRSEY